MVTFAEAKVRAEGIAGRIDGMTCDMQMAQPGAKSQ
jgi:hypothetical protein